MQGKLQMLHVLEHAHAAKAPNVSFARRAIARSTRNFFRHEHLCDAGHSTSQIRARITAHVTVHTSKRHPAAIGLRKPRIASI
jgi:hypothetical protein